MLNEKQQQARSLFFQTDLTKTQIADVLNVGRRTLHYWIRENNWERLKKNAALLPAMIAENCYYLINNFTQHLLSELRTTNPISATEADVLHKLALTVRKLKNHSTVNESMEMFGYFMDRINKQSPELADQVMPFVSEFIEERAKALPAELLPKGFNSQGFISAYEREEQKKVETVEIQKDIADLFAWEQEENPTLIDIDEFRRREADMAAAGTPILSEAEQAAKKKRKSVPSAPASKPKVEDITASYPAGLFNEAELEVIQNNWLIYQQDHPTPPAPKEIDIPRDPEDYEAEFGPYTAETIEYEATCEKISYPRQLPIPQTLQQYYAHRRVEEKRAREFTIAPRHEPGSDNDTSQNPEATKRVNQNQECDK